MTVTIYTTRSEAYAANSGPHPREMAGGGWAVTTPTGVEVDRDDFVPMATSAGTMTLDELKAWCADIGRPTTGTKADLVARITGT